jgi:ABC-2 type transport system permease protein
MSHIAREFVKLRFQKRTYFGLAGLFLVPFLVTLAMRFAHGPRGRMDPERAAGQFFFNLIAYNGLYVAVGSLFALSTFLLPLLAAMSGSQTIAGEAESGTLRTVLMQPVRRGAVLSSKLFVANLYVLIGLAVLIAGSFIAGGAVYGFKPMTLLTGQSVGVGEAVGLIFSAYLFVFVGMAAVVSLALLFSTLTNSGLTAVAGAMVLVIVMLILGSLDQFDFLRPYLFTYHFSAWTNLFLDPIDWEPIRNALINFGVWIAGTTGIGWLIFRRKDILS